MLRHMTRSAPAPATNTSAWPAISLHVYGPALSEMTRYRIEDGRLTVAAVDRAGAAW